MIFIQTDILNLIHFYNFYINKINIFNYYLSKYNVSSFIVNHKILEKKIGKLHLNQKPTCLSYIE